ncbi:hypothetical protein ACFL23_03515 [Patescibacteria group bacterium]
MNNKKGLKKSVGLKLKENSLGAKKSTLGKKTITKRIEKVMKGVCPPERSNDWNRLYNQIMGI